MFVRIGDVFAEGELNQSRQLDQLYSGFPIRSPAWTTTSGRRAATALTTAAQFDSALGTPGDRWVSEATSTRHTAKRPRQTRRNI